MITKSDFWKLLQSEFKQIRRSQLLTKKVMDSIKEVEPDESDEAERSSNKEMNDEGKYQGYAKGSFKKMLVKIAQGKVKNTAPFTEDPHTGKSAPPGQGES